VYKFHLFLILFFVGFFFLFGASLTVSRAPPPDLPYAPTHIPSLSLSYVVCVCVVFSCLTLIIILITTNTNLFVFFCLLLFLVDFVICVVCCCFLF